MNPINFHSTHYILTPGITVKPLGTLCSEVYPEMSMILATPVIVQSLDAFIDELVVRRETALIKIQEITVRMEILMSPSNRTFSF